jgi:hypothetical protein
MSQLFVHSESRKKGQYIANTERPHPTLHTHFTSEPCGPEALRRFFNLNTSRNIAEMLGATKRAPTIYDGKSVSA